MKNKYLMKTLAIGMLLLVFSASYAGKAAKGVRNSLLNKQLQSVQSTATYQVKTQLTMVWNAGTKAWQNSDKKTFNYNSSGLLVNDLDQGWDSVKNTWFNNSSDTFAYDNLNRLISYISTQLDQSGTSLIYATKTTDSFSGNTNYEINYNWANYWLAQSRDILYSYNGHDTLDINQTPTGSNWTNFYKVQYLYNSKGLDSQAVTSQWNNGQWELNTRTLSYYDAHGRDTLFANQQYDSVSGKWSYVSLQDSVFTYNSSNEIIKIVQNNSYNGINWSPVSENDYSYDANGNDTQTTSQNWDTISNGWVNNVLYSFTYNTITGMHQVNDQLIAGLYPNPMTETATFEVTTKTASNATLSILDMNGKLAVAAKVITLEPGENNIEIQKKTLFPGTYFVVLCGNGISVKSKLIIE